MLSRFSKSAELVRHVLTFLSNENFMAVELIVAVEYNDVRFGVTSYNKLQFPLLSCGRGQVNSGFCYMSYDAILTSLFTHFIW